MKKALFYLFFVFILSCTEDKGTPIWRVWYAVELTPNYDVDISYFSDKYHATGVLESINIHDSSYVQQLDGFWIGQHFQDSKETGYYIDINIKALNSYNGKLGVYVYANDTSLLDSAFFPFGTTNITLQGEIPKLFK
tara:strand:- start:257 stop:667 length:411 start_codon:yes stop_codon:yes gene_type:complete